MRERHISTFDLIDEDEIERGIAEAERTLPETVEFELRWLVAVARRMMTSSITLGRIAGIRIGIHWSWLVVFGLITWSLATAVFPDQNPGLGDSTYIVMAVVAAVLFFTSLLLHELGHAFQARREGMEIDGITLWLFGGVAQFRGMFPTAGAEFRIAIAGPLVSLVLGAGFVGIAVAIAGVEEVDGIAAWLGYINLALLVFNLLPALPLDGGRVLRSALWARAKRLQLGDACRGGDRARVRRALRRGWARPVLLRERNERALARLSRVVSVRRRLRGGALRARAPRVLRAPRARPDDPCTDGDRPRADDRRADGRRCLDQPTGRVSGRRGRGRGRLAPISSDRRRPAGRVGRAHGGRAHASTRRRARAQGRRLARTGARRA